MLAARGKSSEARQALSALCEAYTALVVAFPRRGGRKNDDPRELAHGSEDVSTELDYLNRVLG